MASGLDLNGLDGLSINMGDTFLVNTNQNPDESFTITGDPTGESLGQEQSLTGSTVMLVGEHGILDNQAQTASVFVQNPNFVAFSSTHLHLIGWNADGLLFSSGLIPGTDVFIADPATDPTGAFPTDAFTTTSSNDVPFGLTFLSNTANAPCFAAGTRIRTAEGETAVENLKEGDSILTESGAAKSIKWIGNRRVNCRRHPRQNEVMPVRIKANAFGGNLPKRDLLVSPGHSLYVDGVLIPAGFLINGATVVQEEVETIHYYHVELDVHDVVLAEGLPAESYLDDENRHAFVNGAGYAALHPDLDPKSWENACAPRVMAGPQLTEVKQRLIDQAGTLGYHLTDETDVHLLVDGEKVLPCHATGARHWFIVPAGARAVHLNSNSGVPMQLIADHGDGRRLGVAVGEFKVNGVDLSLSEALAANPYPLETHRDLSWVWTDGAVPVAMPLPTDAAVMVEVAIVMSMKSWSRKPNLSIIRRESEHMNQSRAAR